jgi:hypothetical protein
MLRQRGGDAHRLLHASIAMARDHDYAVIEAALADDVGEVLVDVLLNRENFLGHAAGVVDHEDDVDRLLL